MKRIETIDDVKLAMELNNQFYVDVCKLNDADRDDFAEINNEIGEKALKECKMLMADAMDDSNTIDRLALYLRGIIAKADDAIKDRWLPSLDDSIEHWLDTSEEDGDPLYNLIIDNDVVYRITECYAEKSDMTFIMREPYTSDYSLVQECYGWYCGEPNRDDTDRFYGSLC